MGWFCDYYVCSDLIDLVRKIGTPEHLLLHRRTRLLTREHRQTQMSRLDHFNEFRGGGSTPCNRDSPHGTCSDWPGHPPTIAHPLQEIGTQ